MKKLVLFLIVPFALLLGVPTATAQEKTTTSAEANWNNYRPETLNGTITMVEPGTKCMFVMGSSEVSYKFVVTNKTRIEIGGAKGSVEELANQAQKQVTVTFVARPNGNFAQSISVSG
ncbi:MAG TPA: hypothetical protein VNM47_16350 [Terriglobia bacterium]|nr:hypothetical protein [Terriglobia bacterium]